MVTHPPQTPLEVQLDFLRAELKFIRAVLENADVTDPDDVLCRAKRVLDKTQRFAREDAVEMSRLWRIEGAHTARKEAEHV